MATRARRAALRACAGALRDVGARRAAVARAPRAPRTTRSTATTDSIDVRARTMSSLRASARARRASRDASDASSARETPRADGSPRADADASRGTTERARTPSTRSGTGFEDLRKRATTYAAEAAAEVRARARASGIDVDAVDEAAREAGEAARAAGRAGGGGDGGREGEAGKSRGRPPSGFAAMAIDAVKEEYRLAMMDPGDAAAERRKAAGYDEAMFEPYDGTTAVATTAAPKPSAFGKLWGGVKSKLGIASAFDKLEGLKKTAPYAKGAELAEDMRERWETSDSPMVHRIQDFQDQPVQRDRARRGVSHDSSARPDV